MRMFLIVMTDIFLILYLTTITQTPSTSVLTVEDFFKLKAMHETLQNQQQKIEEEFQKQLRLAQEEKDAFSAKLAEEQVRAEEMEESLIISDAELERINEDLQLKENMMKEREQFLTKLNQKIEDKEAIWKKMEVSYKEELENKKESLEANRMLAEKLQLEAQKAQRLANQMQEEADQAYEIAEQAKAVQQNAILLKDEALKEKEEAEQKALEALEARKKAEEEKERAIKTAEEVKKVKEQVEKKAEKLAATIKDITQDGDTAYQSNVRPQMQQVRVTFERKINNDIKVYERELTLMPAQINSQVFVIFPSQHIMFNRRSDKAPQKLVIMYKGKKLARYWINKKDDLVAVELLGYVGKVSTPYPADMEITQFMPALLALRNNGNKSFTDLIRGLSNEYFIVNRDHIQPEERGVLAYRVKGLRGTGMRGERIILGDQLVDLNGRLIGIAKDVNRIIRIDTLNGWEERAF